MSDYISKLTETEYDLYISIYVCEFVELIKEWYNQVQNLYSNINMNYGFIYEEMSDIYHFAEELFDEDKWFSKPLIKSINNTNVIETTMYTILHSLTLAIFSLPKKTNIRKFVSNFINESISSLSDYPNPFVHIKDDICDKCGATYIIQKQWRKSITNPKFLLCRKRLINEFQNIKS